MAEKDNRSYRDSTGRTPDRPRVQADELAELATLLSQSVLMNRAGQDRGSTARETYVAPDEVLEPSGAQYSASDEGRYDRVFEQLYDADTKDRCDPSVRAGIPPSGGSSRFDLEPDFASAAATTTAHERHDFGDDSDEAAYRERSEASLDLRESRYSDDYEEYSEDLDTRRRSELIFVAVIFGFAVLGTAGAFAYRAMFGGPPPIINAEGGPNKIIAGDANSSANSSRQADANAGSAVVPREERLVEMPPPVNPALSTVPIFPDPPPAGGPGAVVGFPALGPSATQPQESKPGANDANGALSIVPSSPESSAATTRPRTVPARPVPLTRSPANETATGAREYAVQVSSERSEEQAQSSFYGLQAKYPKVLGGRRPIIRRADLGAKGVYYRTMVGPFASADQATELCSNLRAAGGSCVVQKN